MSQLTTEGEELFQRLIHLPDEAKNSPAPPELQDQFVRWRRKLLESKPVRSQAIQDTQSPYPGRMTVRLLAYNLELLIHEAKG